MSSFSLDGSPKLTTQQIFSTWKHSNSNKCNLEFFIFAHAGSDILELVVFNCDTSTEFEHVILSKKSVLTQVDDEVATRFEMARHNSADGSNVLATEEELLEECMNETIGEFVVQHVTVDPDDSNKISLAPLSDPRGVPISLLALKPNGRSDLKFVREKNPDRKLSGSSDDPLLSSTSNKSPMSLPSTAPRPSLILKAVDAFKQAAARKDNNDNGRPGMNPAKRRLRRSIKRVMLQNAVDKVRTMLGRPSSAATSASSASSRPNSRNSVGGHVSPRAISRVDSIKEEIEARKQRNETSTDALDAL